MSPTCGGAGRAAPPARRTRARARRARLERRTACSPRRPSSRRTRATEAAARSRTGSSRTARVSIVRPCIEASTPASSADRRASANAEPARTAARREQRRQRAARERRAAQRGEQDRRGARPAEQQPGDERGEDDVPRVRAEGRAGVVERGAHGSDADVLAERGQALLADAGDLVELVDALEAAVLLAVLEDLLGGGGADAVERVELLERGRVEVDRAGGRRRAAGRRRGRAGAAAAARPRVGTRIWRPSSSLAARLSWLRSARRVGPPARRRASSTRSLVVRR